MSPSPDNITWFNTGKDANKLKISYFVSTSPDSDLRRLIFSPISDDLPGLTPITRNILAKKYFREIEKNKYFCFISQEKAVKSTFRISENTKVALRAYPNNPLYCGRLQSPMPALSAKNVLNVEKTTPPSIFGLPPWPLRSPERDAFRRTPNGGTFRSAS